MRILGFTEERTSCECCGKDNLKGTYALTDELGNIFYYGTTCGAKAANWSNQEFQENWRNVKKEIKKEAIQAQKTAWKNYLKLLSLELKSDHSNEDELYLTYKKEIKQIQIKYPSATKAIYNKDLRNIEL